MEKFVRIRGVGEETLMEMLDAGGSLMIECISTAVRKTSNFPGRWHLYVSDASKQNWAQLELFARKEPREFRSAVGVLGFLLDRGFLVAALPLKEGDRVEVDRDGSTRYLRD